MSLRNGEPKGAKCSGENRSVNQLAVDEARARRESGSPDWSSRNPTDPSGPNYSLAPGSGGRHRPIAAPRSGKIPNSQFHRAEQIAGTGGVLFLFRRSPKAPGALVIVPAAHPARSGPTTIASSASAAAWRRKAVTEVFAGCRVASAIWIAPSRGAVGFPLQRRGQDQL